MIFNAEIHFTRICFANHCLAKPRAVRGLLAAALVALALASAGASGAAAEATAEQRAACTPDVFRLCAGEIPNVSRIVACMQGQRSKLSPACAAVFKAPATSTVSSADK